MIRCHTYVTVTETGNKYNPQFQMTVNERTDLLKFQALLNRALNVAPEFGQDWFDLCDKLTEFLERHNIR